MTGTLPAEPLGLDLWVADKDIIAGMTPYGKRNLAGTRTACVFCGIIAGTKPATIVQRWTDALAFVPVNPVTSGHLLVVSRVHVPDAVANPTITAATMARAAQLAASYSASNILTSVGRAATQSVFHLHIHVIPRAQGDQLTLPWGTTGHPSANTGTDDGAGPYRRRFSDG